MGHHPDSLEAGIPDAGSSSAAIEDDAPPAIAVRDLTRAFGTRVAVDRLSLDIPAGCIFGFLGPNGAGKTTTIRVLLGLLKPTSGDVRVFGLDPMTAGPALRLRTGVLLDEPGLYENLSAEENLEFFGRAARMEPSRRTERIRALLRQFELTERRHEPVRAWSLGMKQRLGVARAVLHQPDLVFLDEPTAALDPAAASALRTAVRKLADVDGMTVFLTTHNLSEAEKLCDRVGIIQRGRLVAQGSTRDVRQSGDATLISIRGRFGDGTLARVAALPGVRIVEQSETVITADPGPGGDRTPILHAIIDTGGSIDEVREHGSSLEEAYLRLVDG